jgi:hypothetical protein
MADKVTSEKRSVTEDSEPAQPQAAPAPAQVDITRAVTEAVVAAQVARITSQPATPNMDVARREGGMFIDQYGTVVDANGVAIPEADVPADVKAQARAVAEGPQQAPATQEGV